ncbi:hypothetical protein HS048_02295 [Planomonospora sp. ID91781]|uniref:hypothetical protein n=1 Tax=Planomonospora sp. ID91781 TaxID=2738135 RepID=UPI0018C3F177|nr:hypothetical protein [Planomonospora sp. ID91781]MBG0819589.1 hypothetical protein [Planomonospora sp. ID91781]
MSVPISDSGLQEIEDRAQAATPGPWHARFLDDVHAANLVAVSTTPDVKRGCRWPEWDGSELVAATLVQFPEPYVTGPDDRWDANAVFIAHARSDVPRLLAEVRRLRALLDEARHGDVGSDGSC